MNPTSASGSEPGPDKASGRHLASLTEAVQGLAAEAAELRGYGRHNRRMIWGLVVSIAIDVALTAGVLYSALQAQNATDSADQTRQNQINICQAGNVSRQQNIQLWEYVLNAAPPRSDEERKRREDFREYVHGVFAPRDCGRL